MSQEDLPCSWTSLLNVDFTENGNISDTGLSDTELFNGNIIDTMDNIVDPRMPQMPPSSSSMDNDNIFFVPDLNIMNGHNDGLPSQEMELSESKHFPPPTGLVITNNDYPGNYCFDVQFELVPQAGKRNASHCTYSQLLQKVFCQLKAVCPFRVKCDSLPPPGSVIRAVLYCSDSENLTYPVKCCLEHQKNSDRGTHFMASESSDAEYQTDPQSTRDSVVVKYVPPDAGTTFTTYLYKFMCLGSCPGGPNRRAMEMIFTLEDIFGQVLGRKVVKVRVCACTKRDKSDEENKVKKKESGTNTTRNLKVSAAATLSAVTQNFTLRRTLSGDSSSSVVGKAAKRSRNDRGDTWQVVVEGRGNFEYCKNVIESAISSAILPHGIGCNISTSCSSSQEQRPRNNSNTGTTFLDVSSIYEPIALSGTNNTVRPEAVKVEARPDEPIQVWLEGIGMAAYTQVFTCRNVYLVSVLESWTYEDMMRISMPAKDRNRIWQALEERRTMDEQQLSSQESESSDEPSSSRRRRGSKKRKQ